MPLNKGKVNIPYKIMNVTTKEEGMKELLLTLGCYIGEEITIVNHLASNLIVHIKGSRYSIDTNLAKAICVSSDW